MTNNNGIINAMDEVYHIHLANMKLSKIVIGSAVTEITETSYDALSGAPTLTGFGLDFSQAANLVKLGDMAFCVPFQSGDVDLTNCVNLTEIGDNAFFIETQVDISGLTNLNRVGENVRVKSNDIWLTSLSVDGKQVQGFDRKGTNVTNLSDKNTETMTINAGVLSCFNNVQISISSGGAEVASGTAGTDIAVPLNAGTNNLTLTASWSGHTKDYPLSVLVAKTAVPTFTTTQTATSITVELTNYKEEYGEAQYKIEDKEWQDSAVFEDLSPNTSYTVYVRYKGQGSYLPSDEATARVTTSKHENAWTKNLSIEDWTYGEEANEPMAAAAFGNVTFTYSGEKDGTYTEGIPTEAGTWYVKAAVEETETYAGLEDIKEFTIVQAENKWTEELTIEGWTYGEEANEPTAAAAFGETEFVYSGEKDGAYTAEVPTEIGTWYVKAVVAETTNFTGLESEPVEFVIEKTANEWTKELTIKGWTYGEEANEPTVAAAFGDVTFTYSAEEDGTYTAEIPTEAGTWYVKAAVEETETYAGLEAIKKFTIAQAENEWTEELTIKGWTKGQYDEEKNAPAALAKFGEVKFSYSKNKNGAYTSEVPTEAGTWYVKAEVEETENYTGLEAVKEFKISQKTTSKASGNASGSKSAKDSVTRTAVETADTSEIPLWRTTFFLSGLAAAAIWQIGKKRRIMK